MELAGSRLDLIRLDLSAQREAGEKGQFTKYRLSRKGRIAAGGFHHLSDLLDFIQIGFIPSVSRRIAMIIFK